MENQGALKACVSLALTNPQDRGYETWGPGNFPFGRRWGEKVCVCLFSNTAAASGDIQGNQFGRLFYKALASGREMDQIPVNSVNFPFQ